MGLFGPPNIEKLKAKNDVQGLIKALKSYKDSEIRRSADIALGQIGAPAVQPLIARLKDCDWIVRLAAAQALRQIGDPLAIYPLIARLKDQDWHVRQTAAQALGQIGEPRAVAQLIAVLNDRSNRVRKAAANALGQIGAFAVEPLIVRLKDKNKDVRQAAAQALGQIGDPRAVEPLIARLKDRDWDVRQAAIEALGQIGDPRTVKPLIARLKGKKNVRRATAEALDEMGWQPDQGAEGAAYWIAKKKWDRCVQIGAPAVQPLIARLKDQDEDVVQAAAQALVRIGAPAVEPLIPHLKARNKDVRQDAAEALGQIGDPRAVKPLIERLKDQSETMRRLWNRSSHASRINPRTCARPPPTPWARSAIPVQ